MKILALEREVAGVTEERSRPHLEEEARLVWELTQAGVIREIYFRVDRPAAVLMLECASLEEARAVLATLPACQPRSHPVRAHPSESLPGIREVVPVGLSKTLPFGTGSKSVDRISGGRLRPRGGVATRSTNSVLLVLRWFAGRCRGGD